MANVGQQVKQSNCTGKGLTMRLQIRNMMKTDLDRVGEILFEAFNNSALKHGYAPRMQSAREGTSWAWAMLRHGPNEILIAEVEDRVAGVCCLNPRGLHGGVGPVAVDPVYQGQGIGGQLMNALLKRAESLQSVRLFQEAFNPGSFSLYYSRDFIPVADLLDIFADPVEQKRGELCSKVSELTSEDLDAVSRYDIPRSKFDRRTDLAYYGKWGKVFVYRNRSEVRGFLACLAGSRSVQFGPLVAEGEEEATYLFRHALWAFSGRPCQTRVMARDQVLVRALQESGFKLYCINMLMVRGTWRPGRYIESFGRFPEGA
jgi:GNAT superfamily N-acetyltransferase